MGTWGFIRRRLIRLQPMIVFGSLLGLLLFPLIVIMGSSVVHSDGEESGALCRFCGRISYPLYLVQFPIALCYMRYIHSGQATTTGNWLWGITAFVAAIALAAVVERFCDQPVRRWLGRHWR